MALAPPLPGARSAISTPHPQQQAQSIEAKLVVLGAQGVGKTSLVHKYLNPHNPLSSSIQSTIGASFVTQRIVDADNHTIVRLQIWDTAGQERFRSISRLYYRGAHAALLCYDVTSEQSWEEMKTWMQEMKEHCGEDMPIIHVVGTKTDLVAEDPSRRQVAFERTIAYLVEQTRVTSTPPLNQKVGSVTSPSSKRSSGLWNSDVGWDSCHEISAKDGEGIEEVFRVIARKLVEQRNKLEAELAGQTPATRDGSGDDYFNGNHGGSFRVGYGDKRRSWLGLPSVGLGINTSDSDGDGKYARDAAEARRRGRCC
jgi:small GTP-binding protein